MLVDNYINGLATSSLKKWRIKVTDRDALVDVCNMENKSQTNWQ